MAADDPSRLGSLGLEALSIATPPSDRSAGTNAPSGRSDPPPAAPEGLSRRTGATGEPPPLHLPAETQRAMLLQLEAIFQRAEEAEGGVGVGELRALALDDGGHDGGGSPRIERLKNVRGILDQMWWSESVFLSRATEVLADGSREAEWRSPLGEAGVLDFYLAVISTDGVAHDLLLHALRLVGNCCAETPENRERVLSQDHLLAIANHLQDASLRHVVVPVLYNICVDFELAQQRAAGDGLVPRLVRILSEQAYVEPTDVAIFGHICRLLELVVVIPASIESSPDDAAEILLQLASDLDTDLDSHLALVTSALAHLSTARYQQHLVAHEALMLPLRLLVQSYSRPSTPEQRGHAVASGREHDASSARPPSPESDEEKLLAHMRNSIIQVLSDVSAIPDFASAYPLDSPLIGSLRMWLSVPQAHLEVCACVMLGNLARSDEVCRVMVHDFRIHESLIELLRTSGDTQVLHASTGFLKNLALMSDNKATLGEAGLVEVLGRLWAMDTAPQIQYAGASLTRQVVSGSYANTRRLLTPLSADLDSPAHARTYLSLLLLLCEKSDQAPTKTEVARTITAICRVLNSPHAAAPPEELEDLQRRLYRLHPDLARPLVAMTCQNRWPVVRSEGWFAFALMVRSKEGATPVSDALGQLELLRPLVEVVSGKRLGGGTPGPEEEGGGPEGRSTEEQRKLQEMKRIDRENALVLISKLLEHKGQEMTPLRRQMFEDLLGGRELSFWSFDDFADAAGDEPSTN